MYVSKYISPLYIRWQSHYAVKVVSSDPHVDWKKLQRWCNSIRSRQPDISILPSKEVSSIAYLSISTDSIDYTVMLISGMMDAVIEAYSTSPSMCGNQAHRIVYSRGKLVKDDTVTLWERGYSWFREFTI